MDLGSEARMEKFKISAREIISDVKSGFSDFEFGVKIQHQSGRPPICLAPPRGAGLITQFELYERTTLTKSDVLRALAAEEHVFKCPICGKTIPPHMDECPHCEIVTQRLETKGFIESLDILSVDQGKDAYEDPVDKDSRRFKGVVRLLPLRSPGRSEAAGDSGVNVDSTEPDGTTPLMIAAQEGREEIVELLLRWEQS